MTRAARLSFQVTKEVRGLLLAWLSCVVVMVACAVVGGRTVRAVGMLAYFLGAAALGAQSVGHEFSGRTLTVLLSQPARRQRLLLVKLGVLAVMLLPLGAVAGATLFNPGGPLDDVAFRQTERLAISWLPLLLGLLVAPWLTMFCRSAIAGTVFTVTLPGVLWGALLAAAYYGFGAREVDSFPLGLLGLETLCLCAVGAVMSWRMFTRLEVIEGTDEVLRLPRWMAWRSASSATTPALTTRHPVWMLVKKELRLQQMALALAGCCLLGWLVATSLADVAPELLGPFRVLTIFYAVMVPLLIGSLASAEERQFGTLEWQVLLPMATSKQWAVKVGVALGLTMVLALGLPALLASFSPPPGPNFPGPAEFLRPRAAVMVILLTTGSLYVSSLSANGLRACLVSLPVILGGALSIGLLVDLLVAPVRFLFVGDRLVLLPLTGLLALMLWFALVNHRTADRGARRIWKQVFWMTGCVAIGVSVLAAGAALLTTD